MSADLISRAREGGHMFTAPEMGQLVTALLAENQQLADERTRYRDGLYQSEAENQQLRDEVVRISEVCDCGTGTDALEALAGIGPERTRTEKLTMLLRDFESLPVRRLTNETAVYERSALDQWRARCGAALAAVRVEEA